MSSATAIASVTATLQSILQTRIVEQTDLSDTQVTILPLDKARGANTFNQVNLFLYMVQRSGAWVNEPMPGRGKPGDSSFPPLPLSLYYLVTAFGRNDDIDQPFGHELLGRAMSVLHDYPVLQGADISAATSSVIPLADLDRQPERVRLTFHPLNIDELSKLWTGFGMQYRLSAAYEASLTLIESTRPSRTPVPVLTRGPQDSGVASQADLSPPVPTLTSLTPPNQQDSARLGDQLTAAGFKLDGTNIALQLTHALLPDPVMVPADPGATATSVKFTISNPPAQLLAGLYGATVVVQRPGETFLRSTNTLALTLAPRLTLAPLNGAPGTIVFTATVAPQVRPSQRASLLLNDSEIAADPIAAQTDTLTFTAPGLPVGTLWARLRIDGVDSLLVDRTKTAPVFDPTQKVVLA
jgi:hypothetical protein